VCRRAAFRDVKYQFAPLRAQRTRSFNGFLSDLSVLRGKKLTPIEFSDSLLTTKHLQNKKALASSGQRFLHPNRAGVESQVSMIENADRRH
jgi:hypothetical protein